MVKHYLYRIVLPDRRAYIGVSLDPQQRFSNHCSSKTALGRAIQRYGREHCKFELLCVGPEKYIYALEARAIQKFNTQYPNGYNGAPSERPHPETKDRSTFDESMSVNDLPNRLDAIFGLDASEQAPSPNRGSVEVTANGKGRHAIESIFPGWIFAWRRTRFPWDGWRSSTLHLPSLAANRTDSLAFRMNLVRQLDEAHLASLLALAASEQGIRAAWLTFDGNGESLINFADTIVQTTLPNRQVRLRRSDGRAR
jgi:hypothetical protein